MMTSQGGSSAPAKGQDLTPAQAINAGLEKMTGSFVQSLPKHITVDRFKRTIMTAVNMNPDLASADRRSLFNSALKAASDGLLPDGREAALVTFKDRKNNRVLVQYLPMVFGTLKKLRQSGEIASISARCVYEKEIEQGRFEFKIVDGAEHLRHDPILIGERGKMVLVYATARFRDGTVQNEPMTLADVNKARAVSRTGDSEYGPWTKWFDEMARKTAIKRLSKYLPLSAEDFRVLDRDDEDPLTEFQQLRSEAERAQPQSITHAAAALSAPATIDVGDGEQADAQTGEVIEGDAGGETTGHDADEGEFTDESSGPAAPPSITKIEVPEIDGAKHWKGWADAARNAIPLLDAAHVQAWREAHADKLVGLAAASKKLAGEVEAALKAAEG